MRAKSQGGRPRTSVLHWIGLVVLLSAAVGSQVLADGSYVRYQPERYVTWVRSPQTMKRLAVGLDVLAADVYWIRAVQYYGSTRLSRAQSKNYDQLYPLLDMTTTLDPRFNIAYRFGAILLSEAYPNGPGKPDDAIKLLQKGLRAEPNKWEYYYDAGFVEYWWRNDRPAAADWFLRAAALPQAPNWLRPLAASTLAEGGEHTAARMLWTQLAESGEQEWMRRAARVRLLQLDAEIAIEQIQPIVNRFADDAGRFPNDWIELVRTGRLRGVPVDPTGVPYTLDPVSGAVDVDQRSQLFPLRRSVPSEVRR